MSFKDLDVWANGLEGVEVDEFVRSDLVSIWPGLHYFPNQDLRRGILVDMRLALITGNRKLIDLVAQRLLQIDPKEGS